MSASQERSAQQIENDIVAARNRLAATVDELAYRVRPKTIAQRQWATARASFTNATRTEDGSIKADVVGPAVAAAVAVVVLAIVMRRRRG